MSVWVGEGQQKCVNLQAIAFPEDIEYVENNLIKFEREIDWVLIREKNKIAK